MRSIEVGAGVVTITDETIQLDLGLFGGIKRFHEQSKYIIPILIIATISTVHEAVFGSSPLREFSQFAIILGILTFTFYTLDRLLPRIWNNIGLATELRRTDVKQVEYTAGGRLLPEDCGLLLMTARQQAFGWSRYPTGSLESSNWRMQNRPSRTPGSPSFRLQKRASGLSYDHQRLGHRVRISVLSGRRD
ncbi:hypothetical protein ACFQL7_28510 [Halocatena marina]|uniref:Uncharacterized protein n=1 Tax=Halocatena marina TaxID=2934937 RepID=A0ABD5YW99_9EURY